MVLVRNPAVAGTFYPGETEVLKGMVNDLLAQSSILQVNAPKAIIAPHAGYIYSGPVAATIYKTIEPLKDQVSRVVLLGPAHRVPFRGIATTNVDFFMTPLGRIPVDKATIDSINNLKEVTIFEQAFLGEHSLEVHLPFLQSCLGEFTLVPFVVGDANPHAVANLLQALWGGAETLIVISSDLSHFHDYDTAKKMDQATSKAIESLEPEKIGFDDACGRLPIQGLLYTAIELNLTPQILDVRNSGDTAGNKDRVVGYGAYHLQ